MHLIESRFRKKLPERKIGIDIDDTIGDFQGLIISDLLKKGIVIDRNDIHNWSFWSDTFGDPNFLQEFTVQNSIYQRMSVFDGIHSTLDKLKDTHQIHFITARYNIPFIKEITADWFKRNELFFDTISIEKDKASLAKRMNLDSFIDDNLETTIRVRNALKGNIDLKIFVKNDVWNQHNGKEMNRLINNGIDGIDVKDEYSGIHRVESLSETLGKVNIEGKTHLI